MEKLIYYPGFEIADVEWTKFALLYLDTLSPIIPLAGENQLSDTFRQLRDETDLLNVHRPSYKEGYTATLDALDQVDKILTIKGATNLTLVEISFQIGGTLRVTTLNCTRISIQRNGSAFVSCGDLQLDHVKVFSSPPPLHTCI